MSPARWTAVAAVSALLGAAVWVAIERDPEVPLRAEDQLADPEHAGPMPSAPRATADRQETRADVDESGAGPDRGRTAVALGRILDAFGRPCAGARVFVDDGDSIRRPAPHAAATSGPDGRFELIAPPLRGRVAWLSVREPVHAAFDLALDPDGAADVGELHLQHGGKVTGLIATTGDLPVAGATVRLSALRSATLLRVRDRDAVLAPAQTGADGRFTLARIPPGAFRLEAFAARTLRERRRDALQVEDESTLDVGVLHLGAARVVRGLVTAPDGTGIAAADVVVRSASRGLDYREAMSTDADGAFGFDHAPLSPLRLEVSASGYVSWRRDDLDATGDLDLTVVLLAGLTIQGRVVDTANGAAIESFAVRALRLAGTRSDDPSPLEDVARSERGLGLPDADPAVDGRLRVPASLATPTPHPGGTFTVEGLDEGVFVVDVRAPGYVFARSEPFELRAAGAAPVTVALRRGARVAGRIVSVPGQRAVAGARVTLATPGDPGSTGRGPRAGATIDSAMSDARGWFEFEGVAHGRYQVGVRHGGFADIRSAPFDVAGDRDDLLLEAPAPAELRGKVTGLARDEVERARVVAFGGTGRLRFAAVGADGNYELGPLMPGPYLVRAFVGEEHRFLAEEPELFRSRPPEEIAADLVLEPGDQARHDLAVTRNPRGGLVGIVRQNGAPVANARVRPGTFAPVRADAAGRYELRDLPPGPIDLAAQLPDAKQLTLRSTVTIFAGTTTTWDVEFTTGGLRGSTTGAGLDGVDTTAILIPLDDGERAHPTAVTIPVRDGRFDVDRLPSGPARLRVPVPGSAEVVEIDVSVPVGTTADVVVRRS